MLTRQEAQQLLEVSGINLAVPQHRAPLQWYRLCDVIPATIADSHMVVNRVLAELRAEEADAR